MGDIIEILEEYKKLNSYVSLKRLSKRLNLPVKKTRRLVYSNPKILKKSYSEVNNSGISNRWLYYLE